MIAYLIGALAVAAMGILLLLERRKRERAESNEKRLTNDLVSAAEQVKRVEESNRVLRDESRAQSEYLAQLANDHPDLVHGFVVGQLRAAGRLTADPSHPRPAAPVSPGDGGAGDH